MYSLPILREAATDQWDQRAVRYVEVEVIGWLAEHATTRVGPRGDQLQVPVEALEAVTVERAIRSA